LSEDTGHRKTKKFHITDRTELNRTEQNRQTEEKHKKQKTKAKRKGNNKSFPGWNYEFMKDRFPPFSAQFSVDSHLQVTPTITTITINI